MNHKDLDVWKSGTLLTESVYTETANFPKYEPFGITSRLRRAAGSVSANIAKGFVRHRDKGNREFKQFLSISSGSRAKLETLSILSNKIEVLNDSNRDDLLQFVTQSSNYSTV